MSEEPDIGQGALRLIRGMGSEGPKKALQKNL